MQLSPDVSGDIAQDPPLIPKPIDAQVSIENGIVFAYVSHNSLVLHALFHYKFLEISNLI